LQENVPGEFPLLQVYILSNVKERSFSNVCGKVDQEEQRLFHYVVQDCLQRLSTTFDGVTLYGNDPHVRPDIYGKSECRSFNLLFG
jgi:methylmalonyl-CoA mutase